MKKITLLILTLFFSIAGFSQFSEGFEGTTLPDLATKQWTLGSGTWGVFDNGVGTTRSWGVNTGMPTPPTPPLVHSGLRAAYLINEQIGIGNTSQDFLATPLVTIPTNGELKFWARTLQNGPQGTIYKIMVSTTPNSQTNPAAYTLVQEWNEDQFVANYNIYEEKTVDLSAFAASAGGTGQVYIAFVMEFTQPTTQIGGDRWLLDDVRIVEKCLDPTTLGANNITQNSANLTWANPGNATNFEIQVLPATGTLGLTGVPVTGTTYPATGTTNPVAPFTPSTLYKFYVRAICTGDVASAWVGPFSFSTSSPGLTCTSPIIIPSGLPYTTTDNTVAYGDTTDVIQAGNCGGGTTNYMTGNDVFYSYTPTTTGAIQIEMTPGAGWSGMFVYEGCDNVGLNCVGGVANSGSNPRIIPSLAVTAGTTYIIVLSSNATPQTFPYTLTIQALNCASPNALSATGTGPTSANLSWGNPGNATSWEVFVQTAGSPIPTTAGTTTTNNINFEVTATAAGAPLVLGTPYQYWVRADCGDGTFSIWAGPYVFNTTICASGCNYIFTVADSWGDGWNGNTMNVVQSGIIIATLTGPTSAQGTAQVPISVPMCDGPFQLLWNTGGSFGNEVSVSITNSFGQVIYTKPSNTGTAGTTLYSGVVDCNAPACLPPLSLANATAITPTTAQLSWTPNGAPPASWEIFAVPQGSPAPTATTTPTGTSTTNSYTATGLTPDTVYVYYVRAVCAGGGQNLWSAASAPFTTLPTCPKPTALTVSNVAQSTATFAWTAGSTETAWEYIIVPAGSPIPTATDAGWATATNPLNVNTGLIQGSNYSFYVRAVCSPTDKSTPAGPLNFSTLQIPATLPFTDGFEGTSSWNITNGNQLNKWFLGTAVSNTGTKSMYISNNNGVSNAYTTNTTSVAQFYRDLAIPAGTGEVNVQFDWRAQGESSWDYIRVWAVPTTFVPTAGTQIAAAAGFIQLGGNINQNSSWSTSNYVVNAAGFAGGTMRLVFEWRNDSSGGTQPPGAIDNVVVNVITCSAPSALVLNNVGQTTADISWTAPPGGAPASYDYYQSSTNTNPTATTDPTGNVIPANLQLDNLAPSTTYYVWVRANCGADGTSTWIGPISITTSQIPADLPFIEGFEGDTGWSFTNGTQTNNWIIGTAVSNGGTKSLYITNNNGTSNAYTTSATTTTHAYRDIQMPAVIGEVNVEFDWRAVGEGTSFAFDYLRVWVVPTTFVPTAGTLITTSANRKQIGQYNNNGQWQHVQQLVDAAVYSGQSMRIVFEWRNDGSGGAQPPAAIDNVVVNALVCPAPINLTASAASGSTAITLAWTPVGTETTWEVIVQVAGTGPPVAGTGTIVTGTPTMPFTATAGVFYEFYVIANCSPTESSFWAGPQAFSIYTPPGCAEVQLVGVGVDIVDAEIILCAEDDEQCVNLSASYFGIGSTTSYEVSSIDYDPPFPFTGGIEMPITSDDDYTPSFTLPFNFCFFGESYDFVRVGDNGVITFGLPFTDVYGEYCPWTLSQPIPNTGTSIKNAIYGVFQDMYTTNNPGPNTSINYQVLGTYPCRALVVNFNEVPAYGGSCSGPQFRTTTQIVLYEISNVIEIYVKNRTACSGWQSGLGVLGIQNAAGTVAYTPPGRNTGAWNASNEAWRFEPNGESNVDFQWLKDGVFYADTQDIEVCISETTLMTAQATYQGCDGVDIVTTSAVTIVTTTEIPTEDPIDLISCSSTGPLVFDLTQNTTTILAGAVNPTEFTVTYYLTQADADAQINPILNPTTFEGVNGQTIYVGINSAANCFIVKSFQLIESDTTPAVVEFTYTSPICYDVNTPNPMPIKADGFSPGGTFTAAVGITIDATTGAIDLSTNPEGTFDVTYTLLPSACNEGGTFTFPITINTAPTLDAVTNQNLCEGDSYELPALTVGNYFTATQGVGPLTAGDMITTTQTIYVYAVSGTCSSELSFEVTVTPLPVIAPIEDVVSCGPYTLPALTVGNYYTATAGGGVMLPAGSVIATNQTIFVYATTGTTPDCSSEISFDVEIVTALTLAPIADVSACDSYTLPILAQGNYFTATQGDGLALVAGDTITSTQTIYVFATGATADCNAEISFMVTINTTPVIAPIADVVSCGPYTLPTLAVGNYFTAADGLGTQIPAGTAITTDQTVYVFATTATTPDCTASASFEVDIIEAIVLAPIANVSICTPFTYVLPALTEGNYYTQPNGGGQSLQAGDEIATTQTIYVFAASAVPTCNSEVSFTVTVTQSPIFAIQGNCVGNQYILTSAAVDSDLTGAVYQWTTTSGNIIGSSSDATVTVEGAATYTLTVTVGGCSSEQDFVADNTSCMIQKGISPNGDGLNDYFDLEGQGVSELEIFNRYGTKVYNQNNYSNEWVGQSNKGNELPDGVYYYVIKRASGENRTGWIYINR